MQVVDSVYWEDTDSGTPQQTTSGYVQIVVQIVGQ